MGTLKQCDRCGITKISSAVTPSWKELSFGSIGATFHPESMELCPDCFALVREALRKPDAIVKQRPSVSA